MGTAKYLPHADALPVSILHTVATSLPGLREVVAVSPTPCSRGPWWDFADLSDGAHASGAAPRFGPVLVRLHNKLTRSEAASIERARDAFTEVWLDLNSLGLAADDYTDARSWPTEASLAAVDALAPKVTELGFDDFWANSFEGREDRPRWQARMA